MARNVQQIIEDLLGKKDMQIAALTAQLEDATEKADALQKALDAVPVTGPKSVPKKEATG